MGIPKGSFEQSGVFTKIFVLLAITLFFTLLVSPIVAIITFSSPSDIGLLKLSQLLLSIAVIVLPPIVLAYLISSAPWNYLNLYKKKTTCGDLILVILFMILIIPFINLLGDLNHHLQLPKLFSGLETWMKHSEDQATSLTQKFLNVHNFTGLLYNLFLIALIPAIGEELYFRGALQGIIKQWKGIEVSIWITAIIFSTIHFQFYGFLPRMLMGAFFGYLLFWSENLLLPVIAHFTNNAIAVIFYYLKFNGFKLPDIDSIGIGNTMWVGVVSGVIGMCGFFWIKGRFGLKIRNAIKS
jgi:membrane protease YdiL (CAAX protease family)